MNKIERFQVEMTNSASELIDYFIKRRGARRHAARLPSDIQDTGRI